MKPLTALLLCISTCTNAQVRIAMNGDTLTGNIKKMTESVYNVYRPTYNSILRKTDTMKCAYTCDTAIGVENVGIVSFYNNHSVTSSVVMRFDNNGHIIEKDFYTDIDSLYMKETYRYDQNSREIEACQVTYPFHASSTAEYDEVVQVKDSMGFCTEYKYDGIGNMIEMTIGSVGSQEKMIDERTVNKYDSKGNKTEEDNFKRYQRDNYVTFQSDGNEFTSKTIFKYDGRNRLIERTEYALKKPAPDAYLPPRERYSTLIGNKEVYTYDGQSKLETSITYLRIYREKDGTITTEKQSTGEVPKYEKNEALDKHGNVIKRMNGKHLALERQIEYY